LDETIRQFLAQLEHVIPFDTASVQLLRNGYLEIVGGSGWSQPERVIGRRLPVPGNNPNTVVVLERQILRLDDAPSQFPSFKEDIYSKIHSWLGTPLIAHDQVIGMLALDSYRPHHFTPAHTRLAKGFATQVAIALENSRLYQSAKEAAERRAVLHEASQEIVAASLDSEGIYTAVHHAASRLMTTEAFVIALFDKQDQMIDAVYLIDREGRTPSRRIPWSQGLSGAVIASGESVLISNLSADLESGEPAATGSIQFGSAEDVHSILAVPMRLGGKITGMISAQSYRPNDYTLEDQHLLEMLASYAAIALENLHLFKEVQRLAITDPLTDLHNRRHLFNLGEREFVRARRFERPLSAILVDIDHFKNVNDRYGHTTGDLVLKVLAQRLLLFMREVDIVGRYGGEEFVILLPETTLETATRVAERLRAEIQQPFNLGDGRSLLITVSLGVSTTGSGASNLATLIHQADMAMYSAKNAGRNRVVAR
jgi:diguanylate cyclase (GGDEF)-like protein